MANRARLIAFLGLLSMAVGASLLALDHRGRSLDPGVRIAAVPMEAASRRVAWMRPALPDRAVPLAQ